MSALNFPTSPTINQTYTAGGRVWIWDGTTWTINLSTTAVNSSFVQYEVARSSYIFSGVF